MNSNKTNGKLRSAITPQRSHGKARVAALLEAAAAVITEKGYDVATMAEIAARAEAPIGSLYRFFPSKEILADALIQRYTVLVNESFDAIDYQVTQKSLEFIADAILDLMLLLHGESQAMLALLEGRSEASAKRMQFREMALKRIGRTLTLCAPTLPKQEVEDIAVILLLNMKTMKALKFGQNVPISAGAADELRLMNRLYLTHKLGRKPAAKVR